MFFDISELIGTQLFYFIVSSRGIGKTFSSLKYCLNNFLKNGDEAVYLRRLVVEKDNSSKIVNQLNEINSEIEYKNKGGIIYADKSPFLYLYSLNDSKRSIPLNKVNTIIFDEFVPSNGIYLKREIPLFLNFYETVNRLRFENETKVLFLGNNGGRYNLYTNYFNIELNNNSFKNKDIVYKLLPPNAEFVNARKNTQFGRIIANTPDFKYMYENEDIRLNNEQVTGFPPNVKPLFNLNICGYDLGFYTTQNKIFVSTVLNDKTKLTDDSESLRYYKKSIYYDYIRMAIDDKTIFFKDIKSQEIFVNTFRLNWYLESGIEILIIKGE